MDPEILAYIEPYERRRDGYWVYYSAPPSFVPVTCGWSKKPWGCVVEVREAWWFPVYRVSARVHFVHVDGTRRSSLSPAKPRPFESIERTVFIFAVKRRGKRLEFDGRDTVEFRVRERDL